MLTPGSKYYHLVQGIRKLPPGQAFLASQGAGFTCTPETFRNVLYQVASTAGGTWHVSVTIVKTEVVWAFWKQDDLMRPNLLAYPIVKTLKSEPW